MCEKQAGKEGTFASVSIGLLILILSFDVELTSTTELNRQQPLRTESERTSLCHVCKSLEPCIGLVILREQERVLLEKKKNAVAVSSFYATRVSAQGFLSLL